MLLALLALHSLPDAAAAAGPSGCADVVAPSAREVAAWSAEDYLRHLSNLHAVSPQTVDEALARWGGDPTPEAIATLTHGLVAEGEACIRAARALPTWHGGRRLRATRLALLEFEVSSAREDFPPLLRIQSQPTIVQADVVTLERILGESRRKEAAVRQRASRAEERFARRHHVPVPPVAGHTHGVDAAPFPAPELVPAGGTLDPASYVSFASRYLVGSGAHLERITRAARGGFTTPKDLPTYPAERRAAIAAVRAELAAVRADGAWFGDRSLLDANLAYGAALLDLLEGDLATFEATVVNPNRTPGEIAAADALLRSARGRAEAACATALSARTAFARHWRIEEWRAWSPAHSTDAPDIPPSPP